jgi:hypothetical protein
MEKVSWATEEYEHKDRTPDWYWAVGIIALSTAVISIIYKNYIFAVFIVLAAAVLFMFSLRKPDIMEIEINEKGVKIRDEFYPYKMIKSFYVENQGKEKKLLIHSKRILMPIIALPIDDATAARARLMLLTRTKEEEMKEPMSQRIMEHLGF